MRNKKKGKACLISLNNFNVPWLQSLDGYIYDRENLRILWQQIGYDVFIPKTVHPFSDSQLTQQVQYCML